MVWFASLLLLVLVGVYYGFEFKAFSDGENARRAWKNPFEREGPVGEVGRVEAVSPDGALKVRIGSELWSASAVPGCDFSCGDLVRVVEVSNLRLMVESQERA